MANIIQNILDGLTNAIHKDDKLREERAQQVANATSAVKGEDKSVQQNTIQPPVSNPRVTDFTNALPSKQNTEQPSQLASSNVESYAPEVQETEKAAVLNPMVDTVAGVFPVSAGANKQMRVQQQTPDLIESDQSQEQQNSNELETKETPWDRLARGDFAGALFDEGGFFDPGQAPLINGSDEDKERVANAQNRFVPLTVSDRNLVDEYNRLAMMQPPTSNDPFQQFIDSRIDDMSFGIENSRSPEMTGEKYIFYQQEMGLGGRPIDEIDPNQVYNKNDEFKYYGFNPIIHDQDMLNSMTADSAMTGLNKMTNKFADLREDNRGDWFINDVDAGNGQILSNINGDNFFKGINDYISKIVNPTITSNESTILTGNQITPDVLNDPNYAKYKNGGVVMIDDNGERLEYPGAMNYEFDEAMANQIISTGDYNLPISIYLQNEDGTPFVDEDGDQVALNFNSYTEFENSVLPLLEQTNNPDDDILQAIYIEPMNVDGVEIPYNTVLGITNNEIGTRDYGFLGMNRPSDQVESFIDYSDEDGLQFNFGLDNVVPGMIDIALNSAPYMMPTQIMAPITLSNMYQASKGLDARSYNNGAYSRMAEDLTPERYASNIAGELFIPITEQAFGVGGRILSGGSKGAQGAFAPLSRIGRETLGEGVEEILQNPIEEAQRYGISGMYADPLLDSRGNVMYDATGHELRDTGTDYARRAFNMATGLPNDFVAGSMMGAGFNAPRIPGATAQTLNNLSLRRQGAITPYVAANPFDRYNQQQFAPLDVEALRQQAAERGYMQ